MQFFTVLKPEKHNKTCKINLIYFNYYTVMTEYMAFDPILKKKNVCNYGSRQLRQGIVQSRVKHMVKRCGPYFRGLRDQMMSLSNKLKKF